MFICSEPQFVYISFTKSGSSSMYSLLDTNFKGKRINRSWKKIPDEYKEYPSFCVVRNPYSRLVSWWWSICKTGGDRYGHIKELHNMGLTTSLADFLTLWKTKNGTDQASFIENVNHINYVLKLENIEDDFNAMPFITTRLDIPKVNIKDKPHWRELIDNKSGQMINATFKRDFELCNYAIEEFV